MILAQLIYYHVEVIAKISNDPETRQLVDDRYMKSYNLINM